MDQQYTLGVLMAIYKNDKVAEVTEAFISVLNQTIQPSKAVIVFDGPLPNELEQAVKLYVTQAKATDVQVIRKPQNEGLGAALADGLVALDTDLVARVDADDISVPERFEKQVAEFQQDATLSVMGSQIVEFENDTSTIIGRRSVPTTHAEIVRFMKMRSGFNHPSVMFRRDAVLDAGNYRKEKLEDYALWVRMAVHGAKFKNSAETLVLMRSGVELYGRRGGWQYFKQYWQLRREFYRLKFITLPQFGLSMLILGASSLAPNGFRSWLYQNVLHRNK